MLEALRPSWLNSTETPEQPEQPTTAGEPDTGATDEDVRKAIEALEEQ